MFTDSHCHLTFPELTANLSDIRLAMQKAQVTRALCICTTLEEFPDVHALANQYDNFWATVGVHPDNEGVTEPSLDDLLDCGRMARVVGIGETGLDYYRLGERTVADMEWQRNRFRTHIRAARRLAKPLVIHTRSASADTLAILREEGEHGTPGSAGAANTERRAARAVCFTALQRLRRLPVLHSIWVFTSPSVAFSPSKTLRTCAM